MAATGTDKKLTVAQLATGMATLGLGQIYSVTAYGAKGDGVTDDSTAINNAVAAAVAAGTGGVIFFPRGNYFITTPINVWGFLQYVGDGVGDSNIPGTGSQITTSASSVTAFKSVATPGTNGLQWISFVNLCISVGTPAAGAGNAIFLDPAASSLGTVSYCTFDNVKIYGFGGSGILIKQPIVTTFRNVQCISGFGHGVEIANTNIGAWTSVSFTACYMVDNIGDGFSLDQCTYVTFSACAADHNGAAGYRLIGTHGSCQGVVFNGCGAEYSNPNVVHSGIAGTATFASAQAFVVSAAATGIVYNGCWTYQVPSSGYGFYATGSSVYITYIGCVTNSNIAGGKSFVLDAGSTANYLGCNNQGGTNTLTGTHTFPQNAF